MALTQLRQYKPVNVSSLRATAGLTAHACKQFVRINNYAESFMSGRIMLLEIMELFFIYYTHSQ